MSYSRLQSWKDLRIPRNSQNSQKAGIHFARVVDYKEKTFMHKTVSQFTLMTVGSIYLIPPPLRLKTKNDHAHEEQAVMNLKNPINCVI